MAGFLRALDTRTGSIRPASTSLGSGSRGGLRPSVAWVPAAWPGRRQMESGLELNINAGPRSGCAVRHRSDDLSPLGRARPFGAACGPVGWHRGTLEKYGRGCRPAAVTAGPAPSRRQRSQPQVAAPLPSPGSGDRAQPGTPGPHWRPSGTAGCARLTVGGLQPQVWPINSSI